MSTKTRSKLFRVVAATRIATVADRDDVVSVNLKAGSQRLADAGLIVDDENSEVRRWWGRSDIWVSQSR